RLCTIASYSFCLSRVRERRDLPSFPTRRSSDLVYDEVSDAPGRAHRWNRHRQEHRRPYVCRAGMPPDRLGQHHTSTVGARSGGSDRKSTRLNSSHVSISYAVFCLKKKKQRT